MAIPAPSDSGSKMMEPTDPKLKEAADFVDQILGVPAPGSTGPASPQQATNLDTSLAGPGSIGEASQQPGDIGATDQGNSQDMTPLMSMVGGDSTKAARLYAVSQRKPALEGKSPAEVATALRSDLSLRMQLMQEAAGEEDQEMLDADNASVQAPKTMDEVGKLPMAPPSRFGRSGSPPSM